MGALVAAAGFRSSTGRAARAAGGRVRLVAGHHHRARSASTWSIYGLTAPFAAALMERFGVRRVVAAGAGAGRRSASGLTLVMTVGLAALAAVGLRRSAIGTGSMALVFGAIVANRWFVRHRGARHRRVLGGQLDRPAGLPAGHRPPRRRSRLALGGRAGRRCSRCCWCRWCCWCCATAPPTSAPRRTARPTAYVEPPPVPDGRRAPPGSRSTTLREAVAQPDLLGPVPDLLDLRLVDQRPDRHPLHPGRPRPRHAGDHQRRPARADRRSSTSSARSPSGWLTDRVDSPLPAVRLLLPARAVACWSCRALLGPHVHPSLFLFIVFYGLDWVATVPPTVALCRKHFGLEKSGVVFGWVFAAHMVGAGVAASATPAGSGSERGDYFLAWMTAGGLCLRGGGCSACWSRAGVAVPPMPRPRSKRGVGTRSGVTSGESIRPRDRTDLVQSRPSLPR